MDAQLASYLRLNVNGTLQTLNASNASGSASSNQIRSAVRALAPRSTPLGYGPHDPAPLATSATDQFSTYSHADLALQSATSKFAPQSGTSAFSVRPSTMDAFGPREQLIVALDNISSEVPRLAFARRYILLPERILGGQAVVNFARDESAGFFQYAIKCALCVRGKFAVVLLSIKHETAAVIRSAIDAASS